MGVLWRKPGGSIWRVGVGMSASIPPFWPGFRPNSAVKPVCVAPVESRVETQLYLSLHGVQRRFMFIREDAGFSISD